MTAFYDTYHSIQASVNRRFQGGFSFGASYTYAARQLVLDSSVRHLQERRRADRVVDGGGIVGDVGIQDVGIREARKDARPGHAEPGDLAREPQLLRQLVVEANGRL